MAINQDGSGVISHYELRSILEDPRLQMSKNDIAALIREFDTDHSGTIDICEFLNMMSNGKNKELLLKAIMLRSKIRKLFMALDRDGSGYITKAEFKQVMKKQKDLGIKDAQLNAIIKDPNISGDGKIDYDKFILIYSNIF